MTWTMAKGAEGWTVPVRVVHPPCPSDGWLVWAHGGSWSGGSVDGWHHSCVDLARLSRWTVVSVEYRLAPRHPHPAALLDVLAAVEWADGQARRESTSGQVAVGGDSAGGTLATCAALVRRDQGQPTAAQLLAYPPIDPTCGAASYRRDPHDFPSQAGLTEAWRTYRGADYRPAGGRFLYSTPLEADDLTGTAPCALAAGGLDPVVDDVRRYAELLAGSGVPVRYQEFPDMRHGAFLRPTLPTTRGGRRSEDPLRSWLGATLSELTLATQHQNTPGTGLTGKGI